MSLYPLATKEQLICALPNRSLSQIQNKANWLGIVRVKPKKMTADEVREAKRKHMAKRRLENPEKVRDYQIQRHYKNHEANKKTMRDYASKRFFWVKAMHLRQKDRATTKQLASMWKKQKGLCALTGKKLDRTAQLDHILPKAKGGTDNIKNLQWLSPEVNLAKRDLTDEQFIDLCASVMNWIGKRIQMVEELSA
jgi:5-methylcytosine-specific restriction endonuclease McrA